MKKPFEISFESVQEVEEREKIVQEQLEALYKQQRDLEKSISKLEAEIKLLNDIELYMRGEYDFVGHLDGDWIARD